MNQVSGKLEDFWKSGPSGNGWIFVKGFICHSRETKTWESFLYIHANKPFLHC